MLAFLAAVTTTIELSSAMALITLRDPVLVAKQAAEVDLLSRGRLRLAVSVGWNREEQRAVGVDPATRGRRIEEMVPLLRRLWTEDAVTHHGEAFTLDQVGIHPRPLALDPDLDGWRRLRVAGAPWRGLDATGGTARRRLQADGADGRRCRPRDRHRPTSARARAAEEGRTLDVEARLLTQLTPPDEWASVVARYRESGVFTHLGLGNRIVGGTVHDQIALIREVERRVRSEL